MWAAGSQLMAATILAIKPKSIVLFAGLLLAGKGSMFKRDKIAIQESELQRGEQRKTLGQFCHPGHPAFHSLSYKRAR